MNPKEFENRVLELLKLQGWSVQPEKLLGHKKVDSYIEKKSDFNNLQKYAVECKYYNSPLDKNDVVKIYADYLPLLENKFINNILLVTSNGVTPTCLAYIDEIERFKHITYKELENSVLNFDSYVEDLQTIFFENNLDKLYVPQFFEEGKEQIENYILDWVDSSDFEPIAILGGYGMGKSSLAKRLAHLQIERYKKNINDRIPIIIELGDISTENKLEGLLGSHFTSQRIIHNYSFQLFLKLNELGKFLIILDGFDEMKKAISWESLIYNLSQLNRLVKGNSKIVLLGRPSAFLTEREQNEALHGIYETNNHTQRKIDWPNYKEITITPFSKEQIIKYIQNHIELINEKGSNKYSTKIKSFVRSFKKLGYNKTFDILTRPVQLKMLLEILPEYTGNINNLTVTTLYLEFINHVMERERYKPSRTHFPKDIRLKFIGEVAFWLWQKESKGHLNITKIDDSLFRKYCKENDDIEIIKRDLLVASIMERRPHVGYHFPHRSFQEFMIAEYLVTEIKNGNYEMADCPTLTLEVKGFFSELIDWSSLTKWRNFHQTTKRLDNKELIELLRFSCEVNNIKYEKYSYNTLEFTETEIQRRNNFLGEILNKSNSPMRERKTKFFKNTNKRPPAKRKL